MIKSLKIILLSTMLVTITSIATTTNQSSAIVIPTNPNPPVQQLKMQLQAQEIRLEQQLIQVKQQLLQLQQREATEQSYKSHTDLHWVDAASGQIPAGALVVSEADGKPLHVCRGTHLETQQPGELTAKGCLISYAGKSILLNQYQVLAGKHRIQWKPADALARFLQQPSYPFAGVGGVVSFDATSSENILKFNLPVVGGFEPERTLYICRTMQGNNIHLGKVVGDKCNIAYQEKEVETGTFEVLFE